MDPFKRLVCSAAGHRAACKGSQCEVTPQLLCWQTLAELGIHLFIPKWVGEVPEWVSPNSCWLEKPGEIQGAHIWTQFFLWNWAVNVTSGTQATHLPAVRAAASYLLSLENVLTSLGHNLEGLWSWGVAANIYPCRSNCMLWQKELERCDLNFRSTMCLLCDFGQLPNLSGLQFLHI